MYHDAATDHAEPLVCYKYVWVCRRPRPSRRI